MKIADAMKIIDDNWVTKAKGVSRLHAAARRIGVGY